MTEAMMHLRTLVEKTPDADVLRDMIFFCAKQIVSPAFATELVEDGGCTTSLAKGVCESRESQGTS